MQPDQLMTRSLRESPHGPALAQIMAAALAAVDPQRAIHRFLRRDNDSLFVGDRAYDVQRLKRIFVVGAGKAGAPMAAAAADILGERLTAGLVIVKEGYSGVAGSIEIVEGGHPLPDSRGVQAATRIAALVESAEADDLVLVLISGGGSALLTLPADPITLEDKIALTDLLLRSGATINEINALRKHLSRIKGGQLAALAAPAQVAALILSDVVGSPLDVIASGPTVPDPTAFDDSWAIVERLKLVDHLPAAIRERLMRGRAGHESETPKPGDPIFERVHNVVIGSNELAAEAASHESRRLGFTPLLLTTYLEGEAREAGRFLAAIAREIALHDRPIAKPALLIAGGETTVTIRGDGRGGRNQELALGAVRALAGLSDTTLVALATDGGDGPTDAAGAVVTGATMSHAAALGLDPDHFLSRNDAYHFFSALDDLLRPGPTRTNVNDLTFVAVGNPG
jgi:glycerate 2-kinase